MNLLITNDDGYEGIGLRILARTLMKKHNVYIIAPDSNRSAVSQHITMFSQLKVRKVETEDFKDNMWLCSGYPADCVGVGLTSNLLDVKFDAVVSGINIGANMGTDIIYSGTCGAARQAVLTGIPAIAVSLDPIDWGKAEREGFKFEALAEFICNNVEKLAPLCSLSKPRTFVNVNAASLDSYKGYVFTDDLCLRNYHDSINLVENPDEKGSLISEFKPGEGGNTVSPETGDFYNVQKGFISISVVYADPLCTAAVSGLKLDL